MAVSETRLVIDGIPVTLIRKRIKNLHLYVKGPEGDVEVTAPVRMEQTAILDFVRSKESWIREKQQELAARPRPAKRQYRSGESLYLWGKRYELEILAGSQYQIRLQGDKAFFTVRAGSRVEQREAFVREWYRDCLKERIGERLPVIEAATGLHCSGWQTKAMTTRWGTCNVGTKKIWLCLWLAKKPPICLDYVILHELVHTRVRNHGADFAAMMDRFMPQWREIRALLNTSLPDDYEIC